MTDPERFQADVLVIGDMGSIRPGMPTLTTALRGMANVMVEVRTLESAKHSGQYGGAAPDVLLAVVRALVSLHDEHGDVEVAGLRRDEWDGEQQPEEDFRTLGDRPRRHAVDRDRRARLARVVGAGDHDRRHRRAVGGRRGQRRLAVRARRAERARASGAGRGRGAGRGDRPLQAQRPFGIELDVRPARPETASRRDRGSGLPRGARRVVGGVGSRRRCSSAAADRSRS